MRHLLTLLVVAYAATALGDWRFGQPVELTATGSAPHFHHLDGAGRRHVTAGEQGVAVAWEDDHSGAPQVYVAIKPPGADAFSVRHRLSSGKEAYEPAIIALQQAWLVAWEQDGGIAVRIVDADGPGPMTMLASESARQVTLAGGADGHLAAFWAQSGPAGQVVRFALLGLTERAVVLRQGPAVVAPLSEHAHQGYPAATWTSDARLVVAWEDRRAGHTRLYFSTRDHSGDFSVAVQLNEHNAPSEGAPAGVGLGSGVMRVALATDDRQRVQAVWLDKRNPASGYAVWGAISTDAGRSFGSNVIVQDDLGSAVPQWHAALTGGAGGFVAAWDDTREGWGDASELGDVLLSRRQDDAWSADLLVPGASGDGYQGSPAVALDATGALHLVWIERDDLSAPTRLMYTRGQVNK